MARFKQTIRSASANDSEVANPDGEGVFYGQSLHWNSRREAPATAQEGAASCQPLG